MVLEESVINNSAVINALSSIPAFANLIRIGQAVGIIIIIYIGFLILRGVLQIKQHKKIAKVAEDLESINKKLDRLIRASKK